MKCDLLCGLCRKRWRYEGEAPVEALRGHTLGEHPEILIGASPIVTLTSDPDGSEAMALVATLGDPEARP